MDSNRIIIGTRGSILALAQAQEIKKMLVEKYEEIRKKRDFQGIKGFSRDIPLEVEIKVIVTTGDKDMRDFKKIGGITRKDIFVKEIEKEMLEGKTDIAVHSLKDMPQITPKGLLNACFPIREDSRDILVSRAGKKLLELPVNSVIGTGSIRRESELLNLRKDIVVKSIRGNIHTRLAKLDAGEYDAIILAAAGLKRTGLEARITEYFEIEKIMPSPGQGILCVQCRKNDIRIRSLLEMIDNEEVRVMCEVEREFSRSFDGGCHTPVGCNAVIKGDMISIKGMYNVEGKRIFLNIEGDKRNFQNLIAILIRKMKKEIGGNIE